MRHGGEGMGVLRIPDKWGATNIKKGMGFNVPRHSLAYAGRISPTHARWVKLNTESIPLDCALRSQQLVYSLTSSECTLNRSAQMKCWLNSMRNSLKQELPP